MINYYFVSSSKVNYLICIKHGLWGAKTNKLRRLQKEDKLLIFVERHLVAIAEVVDKSFYGERKIWFDSLYPYRIKIKFEHILQESDWIPTENIKDSLIEEYGKKWGMCLIALLPQKKRIFKKLSGLIFSKKNYRYVDIDLRIKQLLKQLSVIKKAKTKKRTKKKEVIVTRLPKRGYRGPVIDFRGLVYAPVEENGVIFLFSKIAEDLRLFIEGIQKGYPDAFGVRYVGDKGYPVNIEFEYKSSNFRLHKHDPRDCDIVVCWEDDWKKCPIEVIELKSKIEELRKTKS